MARTLIGILIAAAGVAVLVLAVRTQFAVECEVCISFGGRQICETALAADETRARMEATGSACTQLSSGVTGTIDCTRTRPVSARCSK